jgi:hypothetical protein
MTSEHTVLTTVPVQALAQPLVDFLGAQGIQAYTFEDDTGLDATRGVEIRIATTDEPRAQELLTVFWADTEGKRSEM